MCSLDSARPRGRCWRAPLGGALRKGAVLAAELACSPPQDPVSGPFWNPHPLLPQQVKETVSGSASLLIALLQRKSGSEGVEEGRRG